MSEILTNDHDTLNLGASNAPHQLTVVMNLSCRYCKKWWSRNSKIIENALADGQLGLHIKFWTVDKAALLIGDIAHQYVDFSQPEAAFNFVKELVRNQNQFKRCSEDQVPDYLTKNYNVTQHNSKADIEQTTAELRKAGVRGIPTLVLDGEWHDSYEYHLPEL
ncbi:thioredoxin domain-containing protein [Lactobacillus sp. Sy-1]|uniref:thioredoxin domain-containing protein n=1 Tax=Lactobacillus sp. Sy-1 TaxID=2109645 RepID=UPI001C5B03C4|nr:thioredoxin domain-containing protein [Lactobacillus sp. Sy-1]MBW1606057.1 thioredoxin domain-containing protein [Lactobacillus sp. Sy-1]